LRDGGEQADDVLAQALQVGGDEDVVEAADGALGLHGIAHQALEQGIVEGGFHFQTRKSDLPKRRGRERKQYLPSSISRSAKPVLSTLYHCRQAHPQAWMPRLIGRNLDAWLP
jgi:hypothetical protein